MPRRRQSGDRLIELFLDMLSAERGGSANTLEAYRHDLDDLAGQLPATGTVAAATTEEALKPRRVRPAR